MIVESYFISYVNSETNQVKTDTYTHIGFAIGGVSDLMKNKNIQIKSIIKVECKREDYSKSEKKIYSLVPKIVDNKLTLDVSSEGKIGESEKGLYVMVYQEEGQDFEIMFSQKKEDILNFFAINQGSNINVYETYKIDTENCIFTKTKIEVENYNYVLTEGDN